MNIKKAHAFFSIIFTIFLINENYAKPTASVSSVELEEAKALNISNVDAKDPNIVDEVEQQTTPLIRNDSDINTVLNEANAANVSDVDEQDAKIVDEQNTTTLMSIDVEENVAKVVDVDEQHTTPLMSNKNDIFMNETNARNVSDVEEHDGKVVDVDEQHTTPLISNKENVTKIVDNDEQHATLLMSTDIEVNKVINAPNKINKVENDDAKVVPDKVVDEQQTTMTLPQLGGDIVINNNVMQENGTKTTDPSTVSVNDRIAATMLSIDETENKVSIDGNVDNEEHIYRQQYAKRMLSYMNQSTDPCDDFYEYACGNWKNTLLERQSPHKRNNLLDIGFELADMVEGLLAQPAESLTQKYAVELEKARIFQRSCLSANLSHQMKSEDYVEFIRSIGGFPAIDETWHPDNFSWFNTSAHLSNFGGGGLINEEIVPQYPFPPYFKLLELGFDLIVHSDNIDNNLTRGYKLNEQRMRTYLTTYGVNEPKVSEVIASIFELWHAILTIFDEFEEDTDKCNELGISKNVTDWEEWQNYFDIAWNGIDFEDTADDCPCPYLYARLDEICNERKEAVANYLAMKFLYRMDARLENEKFQKEFCNIKVRSSLSFLIDQLYMAKYFHPEIRIEVSEITKQIRDIFRETLEKLDWLDEETRQEALKKESTIESRIGSFEDSEITDRLIREISKLQFDESNYEKNNVELTKFRQYMKRYNGLHHKELKEDTKPLELLLGMQVNAFYYNIDNSINVMAGILHPPAYHKAWPFALKYGTLGYLIGHEFTHGFDTVGAFYDSNGEERLWWSMKSEMIFTTRTDCYVNKFNEYNVPEIKRFIDGNLTKDENIADNGGLRNALSAYHHYIKEHSVENDQIRMSVLKEEHMPGLELTPEQLFFLGFAQLWCADYKEEHFWEELTNQHTIDKYRVLGAVSNIEDFANAYNCPLGSRMNPTADRCELW